MLLLFGIGVSLSAQDFSDFEKKVTEFTLPNGLHFILAERHEAPVVSFHTYVNAGSVDDPSGQTGLAHMFEHMAFKGTETIGTADWPSEKTALEQIEEAYDRLEAGAQQGCRKPIQQRVMTLETAGEGTPSSARRRMWSPNEYTRIIEGNGGVGMNAGTSWDSTRVLLQPAFEPDRTLVSAGIAAFPAAGFPGVLQGARCGARKRTGCAWNRTRRASCCSNFLATAFEAHPYRNPAGRDGPAISRTCAVPRRKQFFDTYYVPSNIVIAIVGDVNPAEARRMAERYFGPMRAKPLPPVLHTEEPPQPGPRTAVVESCQPAGCGRRV